MANRKRLAVLVPAIGLAVVGSEIDGLPFAIIGVLILYGLWAGINRAIVSRNRYVGGIVLSILSVIPLAIGFLGSWVGVLGVFLLGHGVWLSVTAAAQLD